MAKSLSLLERLGGSKEEIEQPKKVEKKQTIATYSTRTQTASDSNITTEASAFAGRHSAIASSADKIQDLRSAVHRRIINEMSSDEQAMVARGENARDQIKNIIAAYAEREISEHSKITLSRSERFQLVEDIATNFWGSDRLNRF